MKKFPLFAYCVILLTIYGCGNESSQNISKSGFDISINCSAYSNGQAVKLGNYYKLNSSDSIMVERLDFYMQDLTAFSNLKSFEVDSISFFSLSKQSNTIYYKSDSNITQIDSFKFLCGLDAFLNTTNPNSVPDSHPLSSSHNMYWTDWTKYRYVILEGKIKLGNGQVSSYSFHTGQNYRKFSSVIPNNTLVLQAKNELKLILNLEKIFIPNTGTPIDYKNGELQAHSDVSDAELTQKFATNFARAFSMQY